MKRKKFYERLEYISEIGIINRILYNMKGHFDPDKLTWQRYKLPLDNLYNSMYTVDGKLDSQISPTDIDGCEEEIDD